MARNFGSRAASLAALLLLSMTWAVGTLRADLLPGLISNPLPHLQRQAVPFVLLTFVASLVAAVRREQWPRGRQLRNAIVIGLGLFVAPVALVSLADGWVPGLARAALFTLTPVFALVFEPYIGSGRVSQSRMGLMAALGSVAGALFIFPVDIPALIEAAGGLCAVILATACVAGANCKAVAVFQESSGHSVATQAAIAAATAAITLAAMSIVMELMERPIWKWDLLGPELLWSMAIEVPALFLLFWLMPRMSAPRMATRYVIAPLLAILVGAGLMRAALVPRTWLGLLLMATGAAYLLLAPDAKPDELSLR